MIGQSDVPMEASPSQANTFPPKDRYGRDIVITPHNDWHLRYRDGRTVAMEKQPPYTILLADKPGLEKVIHSQCVRYNRPYQMYTTGVGPLDVPSHVLKQKHHNVLHTTFRLHRAPPSPDGLKSLARYWVMVEQSTLVLAIGTFDHLEQHIQGRVGWVVDMAIQLDVPVYVYDFTFPRWCHWDPVDRRWYNEDSACENPTIPPTIQTKTLITGGQEMDGDILTELDRLLKQ